MPYSTFSFDQIKLLGIEIKHQLGLFADLAAVDVSEPFYHEMLEDIVPLALSNNTEKARSEFVTLLLAFRRSNCSLMRL